MKHTQMRNSILCAAMAAALLACGGGGDDAYGPTKEPLTVAADGSTSFDATRLAATLQALPRVAPSTQEQDWLATMREEEKLAHDIYARLDSQWGAQTRTFANIAQSESTHTEAVRQLLVRYALPDPTSALAPGVFVDAEMQALYTALTDAGAVSRVKALGVGAAVEELDILDIQRALQVVDNEDIRMVLLNLMKGSRNHLRSFVGAMLAQGEAYLPQYLDRATYDAIVNSPHERGGA